METEDTQDTDDSPALEPATTDITVPEPDAGDAPDRREPQEGTRRERRERVKYDFKAEIARRDAIIERESAERQRIDRELAELKGRFSATEQRGQGDDLRTKITSLRQKMNNHLANAAAATKNPDLAQREMDAYYETQEAIDDLRDAARWEKRRGELQSQPGPDPEQGAIKVALGQEFPWLNSNKAAVMLADGFRNSMLANGAPDTLETFRAACAQAGATLRLGGRPGAPSDQQRQRYAGIGSGEGGNGGAGPRTVKMDDHLQKMAEARYPELTAEQAHQKWAREIGVKLQAQR